jgi:chromosomal replication initiation ATPase DnaA
VAPETIWYSAFDLTQELVEAIREDRLSSYRASFDEGRHPLCVEHLEDLREKPRTREEFRRLLQRAARQRPVLLTLTRAPGDAEVLRWLRSWAELHSLD